MKTNHMPHNRDQKVHVSTSYTPLLGPFIPWGKPASHACLPSVSHTARPAELNSTGWPARRGCCWQRALVTASAPAHRHWTTGGADRPYACVRECGDLASRRSSTFADSRRTSPKIRYRLPLLPVGRLLPPAQKDMRHEMNGGRCTDLLDPICSAPEESLGIGSASSAATYVRTCLWFAKDVSFHTCMKV